VNNFKAIQTAACIGKVIRQLTDTSSIRCPPKRTVPSDLNTEGTVFCLHEALFMGI
jgi:hypothetical protein